MKKIVLLIIFFTFHLVVAYTQSCNITGNTTACINNTYKVLFDTDIEYNTYSIDAFTNSNGPNIDAIVSNQTENSANIIFLEGGLGNILIQYYDNGIVVSSCVINIQILGGSSYNELGQISDIIGNQMVCGSLDLEISTFIACSDCFSSWTLNDSKVDIKETTVVNAQLQAIEGTLSIDSLGEYVLCQTIYTPYSSCSVIDCIDIHIVKLDIAPTFVIKNENESIFCRGTSLEFVNTTVPNQSEIDYTWTIQYDTLEWQYNVENLKFDFPFPGSYSISLQYSLPENPECQSEISTTQIFIEDLDIVPISCSSNACGEDMYKYQSTLDCQEYNWSIDTDLGEIIDNDTSGITVMWNDVAQYTETYVSLYVIGCDTNVCTDSRQKIELFPKQLKVNGIDNLCNRGTHWYTTDYIPNAEYEWKIEVIDSIRGKIPEIITHINNEVKISYKSFIGTINIQVTAQIPNRNCSVSSFITTSSFSLFTNDNLCPGDLFLANLIPSIPTNVIWKVENQDVGYFAEKTIAGDDNLILYDFPSAGTYNISYSIPSLDFACADPIQFNVFENPEINLIGPLSICPGTEVHYTLADINDNDIIEWQVFINGQSMTYDTSQISVFWPEDGYGFTIVVDRSTNVTPNKICKSDAKVFTIETISDDIALNIDGDQEVCYDAITHYNGYQEFSTEYNWKITPQNIGTIVEGDSTENVLIQWHYSSLYNNAILSLETKICDSTYIIDYPIKFVTYVPEFEYPDSICVKTSENIEILDLVNYRSLEYYVNGVFQEDENEPSFQYYFQDTGYVDIQIKISRPNDCPGIIDTTLCIYIKPAPQLKLLTSGSIAQCPKEDFETVTATSNIQEESAYYTWFLSGVALKSGFGSPDMYSVEITREMILSEEKTLILEIELSNECIGQTTILLTYDCDGPGMDCQCDTTAVGEILHVTPLDCNLVSFAATVDFTTVFDVEWIIKGKDTIYRLPINTIADLTVDSFYTYTSANSFSVALGALCANTDTIGQIVDTTIICPVKIDQEKINIFNPKVIPTFVCNDDLTYKVILTEKELLNVIPSQEFNLFWDIDGISYQGDTVTFLSTQGAHIFDIKITQCSIDGAYCCTKTAQIKTPKTFDPKIILPFGSCEKDLWLFTLDDHTDNIIDILWDFNDNTGSTLLESEKGFLDTFYHKITVEVYSDLGCMTTDTIDVKATKNIVNGTIVYDADPCQKSTSMEYVENSNAIITGYSWNHVQYDSSVITINTPGIYAVTVTDINGCTGTASTETVNVNASFTGGINYKSEYCGNAILVIKANNAYNYEWFLDGEYYQNGSFIEVTSIGNHQVTVVSIDKTNGQNCDSISTDFTINPLPNIPLIIKEKIYCSPFIYSLSIQNNELATWSSSQNFYDEQYNIQVSENGIYNATVVDNNGCKRSTSILIDVEDIDFSFLDGSCIQACREDLDSLQIVINGTNQTYSKWIWTTNDTLGRLDTILIGSGMIENLLITDKMYNYIQLQIEENECIYYAPTIPLDIITCTEVVVPEPPLVCVTADHLSQICGHQVYNCLLSEENGGPKYYYEGMLSIPDTLLLCNTDTLNASMINGSINILNFTTSIMGGKQMINYNANIFINDTNDFEENGAIINFNFCNHAGEIDYCIDYLLPYKTCATDFDCAIDFLQVSANTIDSVNLEYCLNLHEVVQPNCILSTYSIECKISGNNNDKSIYNSTISENFDDLICLKIPLSTTDFLSGIYNCVEMTIQGDCPDTECSDYNCNIFYDGQNSNVQKEEVLIIESLKEKHAKSLKVQESIYSIYPNPASKSITVIYDKPHYKDQIIITNSVGEKFINTTYGKSDHCILKLDHLPRGLYFIEIMRLT